MVIQTICSGGSGSFRRASRCFNMSTDISRICLSNAIDWGSGDIQQDSSTVTMPMDEQNHCCNQRRMMSTTAPFYGDPLPPSSRYNSSPQNDDSIQQQKAAPRHHYLPPLSPLQRVATLIHSSLTALNDPTRADAVAAVGEVTGSYALSKILAEMESNKVGRRILNERPIVDESIANQAKELMSTRNINFHNPINAQRNDKSISFGIAYATFLQTHKFNPNERSSVRYISDPNLSYVMTRYRQCHDYWHVLTGLPPTVLGELALKWLELIQTGLPLAALSATGGALGLTSGLSKLEREILLTVYLPWAIRVGGNMKPYSLMCVYYEEELETDLCTLRERMGIEVAPVVTPEENV